jgi:hypothetical protein
MGGAVACLAPSTKLTGLNITGRHIGSRGRHIGCCILRLFDVRPGLTGAGLVPGLSLTGPAPTSSLYQRSLMSSSFSAVYPACSILPGSSTRVDFLRPTSKHSSTPRSMKTISLSGRKLFMTWNIILLVSWSRNKTISPSSVVYCQRESR